MKLSLSALTIACIISFPLFCAQQPQKSSLVSSPQTAFSKKTVPFPAGHTLALTIHCGKAKQDIAKSLHRITTSEKETLRALKTYIVQTIVGPQQATLHIEVAQGFQPISLDDKSPYTLGQLAIAESPELWVSMRQLTATPQAAAKS